MVGNVQFFLTKFTSKSCPNLTHWLTVLHDFSVVVGQAPTKAYIFGNYDYFWEPMPLSFWLWAVNVGLKLGEKDCWTCTVRSCLSGPSFCQQFSQYCLKLGIGTRPGHCACRYAIGSALVSLALNKTCNKNERLPGRSGQVGFQKNAY